VIKFWPASWAWPGWVKQPARRIAAAAPPVFLVLALAAACAGSWNRAFEIYELQAYDWRCRLSSVPASDSPVLLVDIWDDALESIGRWPFDREYHAVLMDVLRAHGAASVGMDILFAEPSASDAALADSASKFGRVFFCEAMHAPKPEAGRPVSEGVLASLLSGLKTTAAGVAHVNITVDPDGKRRRLPPVIWDNGRPRFHLGLLLAMDRLGVKESDVRFEPGAILLGDKVRIPVDERGEVLVRFHGRWNKAFEHASYLQLLTAYRQELMGETPSFDLDKLKDRVCIVGLTATATHDINATPVDPLYPQVGVHADFFQNVLDSDFMTRLPRWLNLLAAVLLGWVGWALSRVKRLALGAAASVGVWTLFFALNTALFVWGKTWADLFYPSVLYWGIYLSAIVMRTMQEKRKRELLEAELSIASKIQRSFLPSSLPETEGYEMDVFMRPAKHVGGDLYAALKLDEGHLGLMCGDVSGKGMPAALFMARSVAEFKFSAAAVGLDPAETLKRLNNGISEGDSSGLFVTMNYLVVDLKTRKMSITNGGHMPVARIRANGTSDQLSPDGGMPIGLMGDVDFANLEVTLEPGDVFLMYSDGISEARNRKAQDFEIEKVMEAAVKARALPASGICAAILKAVDQFVGDAPQHDDMTLFVFKVRD
jgi:serine phosphatase RsbU (regulator of sigma subunit)/CHASE2 domain-containing sensor protein